MRNDTKRIEFSDTTIRLRRNLMAMSVLIISITFFDIEINRAVAQGVQFDGLTTDVILIILTSVMVYHVFAFVIHAYEEYRFWEITFSTSEVSLVDGGYRPVHVAQKLKELVPTIEKLEADAGNEGEFSLSEKEVRKLRELIDEVSIYAARFQNFPSITRVRFWGWDIGLAVIVTFATAYFVARHFSCIA